MRHAMRRGTYGEARNTRKRREPHEGDEDRWQSSAETYYGEPHSQNYGSENYDVNRSYTSGREDFGSNSRMAGGWSEPSQPRSFYGKGPKGYQRSDERIKEEVHEVLTWNNEVDASDIEVEVKDGEVSLSGTVLDRRMKRLAEELIEDISGVRDISNQLKIQKTQSANIERH